MAPSSGPEAEPARRVPGGSVWVAALLAGLAGYAVLVLIARQLTIAENSRFLVFWGLMFGLFGALGGVLTETSRAVRSQQHPERSNGVAVGPAAATIGAAAAVILGVSSPVWGPALFGEAWAADVAAVCLGVAGFAIFSGLSGAQVGLGALGRYGVLLGTDGLGRLLLVAIAALALGTPNAFVWATAAASWGWLPWLLGSRRMRTAWAARTDVGARVLVRQIVMACTATAASAVLVVGFPVLVRLTSTDEVYAGAAPLLLALSLTRAPLLVPLTAYQGVVVAHVVDHGIAALRRVLGWLVAATLVGAAVAAAIGPLLLALVNPAYTIAPGTFAGLMVDAGAIAVLTVTGAACLGLSGHRAYVAGWLLATALTVGLLTIPATLDTRVVVSLALGPLAGILVHIGWLRSARRT